jgi:uncharacterized protein (DUF1015 family)
MWDNPVSDSSFMAKIYPFRSLRFSSATVPIEKVVTQPYDKISKQMQERYYALHPNNIVRLVYGKSFPEDSPADNVYTRAAATLEEWRGNGVLQQLAQPAFFVYFQRFAVPGTSEIRLRKGFVGLGQLEDYSNKVVFPHERTLTGPKQDRLELLRHTRTQFEQIFMLYDDPDRRIDGLMDDVARRAPDVHLEDEYGVEHNVWIVTEDNHIAFMQRQMADKRLIIADGHHRYETALAYRDEMGGANGSDRMPMTFFNMQSPGLTVLATHRVLTHLAAFESSVFFRKADEFFDRSAGQGLTIEVFTDARLTPLRLKPAVDLAVLMPDLSPTQRTLDVVVLHRLLIERCLGISEEAIKKESHITYVRDRDAAIKMVRERTAQVAFLLNPTRLDQVRDIAYEGNVLPQKSTDFYPKVLSGLTIYAMP